MLLLDFAWSQLTDINAELPEELGTLLNTDTGGTLSSAGTSVSAQNGIGGGIAVRYETYGVVLTDQLMIAV